jgi:membrane protease YdiL (CAAX protease family)
MEMLKKIFLGPDGKLRPIWRAIAYYVLGTFVVFMLLGWPLDFFSRLMHLQLDLSAGVITLAELRNLTVALICTGALAFYEGRRIDSYGLAINRAFSLQTFEGAAAGFVMAGAVAVGMILLGGMQIYGLELHGSALVLSALAWFGANVCVGIAEEMWFRSYFQQTLWKSIGFWPSATVVALIFAAEHYFFKEGENVWDVITLVSLSLLLSYSMLRTATLWFAVGFHFAFDYMQLFVIGTPNGGRTPVGRLLNVTFNGPAWLTGGVLGTEASLLMYPGIALLWIYVWWRYRQRPPLRVD